MVEFVVDVVNSTTGNATAFCDDGLMNPQAVKTLSGKRGNETRMNVDDPFGKVIGN